MKRYASEIVQLFKLAPRSIQDKLDLSYGADAENRLNHCHPTIYLEQLALALYCGCRTWPSMKKAALIMQRMEIPPEAIHSLIQLTASEEFGQTSNLLGDIAANAASKKGKAAVNIRHQKEGSRHQEVEAAKKEIRRLWATGEYGSREECADDEYVGLRISRKTAREALINTPDPNPWPNKR